MPSFTGTGNIRQQNQNSNLHFSSAQTQTILQNRNLNTLYYYMLLGSGPQNNRIQSFNKRNNLPFYSFSF